MVTTLSTKWRFAQLVALFSILLTVAASLVIFVPKTTRASGTYDNASIANIALKYVGKSGTAACADAGKTGGDQCKQFANCIVWMASNHTQWPAPGYQDGFRNAGGTQVASANAVKGDIIQVGNSDTAKPLHTAIVVTNYGNGKFNVVDANWNYDGMVRQHDYTPPSSAEFWRMGTVTSVPSTPVAVSRASTNMAVFYNDGNGGLVSWSWDVNSGWSSYTWHDTFGNGSDVINGQPCVVARDSSDMDVFYRTAQGRLIHRGWNATNGWEGPDVLLSSGVGDPACIARDSGDLQAFFRTPAGEIKSVSWNWQSSWNLNPQMLYSSGATSDPVAISRTPDSMDVFFGKNNGNLVHLGWTAAYGWNTQDWSAGSGVAGKPTAITRNGGGDMSADYEESSGKLGEEFWNWQTGWGWQDWNAQLVGSPSAIPGVAYPIEVFYRETGGNIVDHSFNGTSWASNWIVGAGGATGNPYAIVRGSNEDVFYWNNSTLMDADWNATNGWSTAPVR